MIENKIKEKIEFFLFKKWKIKKKVEITKSKNHADFSTNIAMQISSILKDSPINIANEIAKNIKIKSIKKFEIANPGFINFFLNENAFFNIIEKIINEKENYGKNNQGKYINVEYVSANPTGFLHIGHARGAVLGSSLVNILKFAGNKVDSEYYLNDTGNQVDILAKTVQFRYLQELGQNVKIPENIYKGKDIIYVAKKFVKKYKDSLKNEKFNRFKLESKNILLKKIKKDLKKYKVYFDIFTTEQEILDKNLIKPTIKKLEKNIYINKGASWLKTTNLGDDKDRVLIKSNGQFTYFMPDLAFHNLKLSRGYDELINIWGADHIGYISRMKIALKYLGLSSDKLDILIVQLVKLLKNGKELKMSKRLGTSYTIQDFLEEVSIDAARWFMIDRSNNSEFIFKIDFANSKNKNNPVFLVQYTHARANQLINKSKKYKINGEYSLKEKKIINLLNKFPNLIILISNNHKVNLLPQYLIELSNEFNSWYSNSKIIGNKNETIQVKLVKATKIVLKNGLNLLGINAPKIM